jgi:hypothetical protein
MSDLQNVRKIDVKHFLFSGRRPTFFLAGFECFIRRAGTKGAYEGLARNMATGVGLQTDRIFGDGAKALATEKLKAAIRNQTSTMEGSAI